jgi:hypothetical protein
VAREEGGGCGAEEGADVIGPGWGGVEGAVELGPVGCVGWGVAGEAEGG